MHPRSNRMNETHTTTLPMATDSQTASVEELINDARRALNNGNRDSAYRLSLAATRQDQGAAEAWLIRARTSASNEERLFCLSQASRLDPEHPKAKQALYSTLWLELEQNPFLAYMDETDHVYYVRSQEYLALTVPKDRGIPESYPPQRHPALTRAYRWLAWSFAGLALAGIGTLIFAPLAFSQAASALRQPIQKPDRVRARLILAFSILLSAIAVFFVWLFLAHFSG